MSVATYLNYYQQGYNYVDTWGGQYYVPVVHSADDSAVGVGDNPPNERYYLDVHTMDVPTGVESGDGCCADQSPFWIK